MRIPLSLIKINILGRFPFVRLQQVLDNPAYLIHIIKKNLIYKRSRYDYTSHYTDFTFLNPSQTLDKLMSGQISLARFGDGEFEQLTGGGEYPPDSDWCQRCSAALRKDLFAVLSSKDDHLLVAPVSPHKFLSREQTGHTLPFFPNMWVDTRRLMWRYLDKGRSYGDANIFVSGSSNQSIDWDKLRTYLRGFDIIIATGNTPSLTHLKIGRRLFFVECGKENAFERKEKIKQDIRDVIAHHHLDKNQVIVFASLGPTAGIIAHQFLPENIRVWDTGHMFKYAAEKVT